MAIRYFMRSLQSAECIPIQFARATGALQSINWSITDSVKYLRVCPAAALPQPPFLWWSARLRDLAMSGFHSARPSSLSARWQPVHSRFDSWARETWQCSTTDDRETDCSLSTDSPVRLPARSERACFPSWNRDRPCSATEALPETLGASENQIRTRRG